MTAVRGDVLSNVALLQQVDVVVKNGQWVKEQRRCGERGLRRSSPRVWPSEGLRSLRSPAAEPVVRLRDLFSRSGLKYPVFEAQGARNGPKVLTVGQMVLAPPSGSKPFWENDDVAVYEAGQLF